MSDPFQSGESKAAEGALEQQLRAALRRMEAPAGLGERILARVRERAAAAAGGGSDGAASAAAAAELDDALRGLLRREPAPAGLRERILARAQAREDLPARRPRDAGRRRTMALRLGAAALAACALVTVGIVRQRQIEARQAMEARTRLLYALQITTRELNWAEQKVNRDLATPGAPARGAAERRKGLDKS